MLFLVCDVIHACGHIQVYYYYYRVYRETIVTPYTQQYYSSSSRSHGVAAVSPSSRTDYSQELDSAVRLYIYIYMYVGGAPRQAENINCSHTSVARYQHIDRSALD